MFPSSSMRKKSLEVRRESSHGSNVTVGWGPAPTDMRRATIIDRVMLDASITPFVGLVALSKLAGLSVRKLRDCLTDPFHPLRHYRVGGKIVVRYSDFEQWIERYRVGATEDLNRVVDEIVGEFAR